MSIKQLVNIGLLALTVAGCMKSYAVLVEISGSATSSDAIIRKYSDPPGATETIGTIPFIVNYNGGITTYSQLVALVDDPTTGSQDGRLRLSTRVNGTMSNIVDINALGLSVLQGGLSVTGASGITGALSWTGVGTGDGSGISALNAGNISSGALAVARGGTNIGSYTTGDILYANGSSSLAKLADVATGNALISGGVGTAPAWGKVGLTTHVSGTLAAANGGTGLSSLGSSNRLLGMNNAAGALEYKTATAGTGMNITHAANSVTWGLTTAYSTGSAYDARFSKFGNSVSDSGLIFQCRFDSNASAGCQNLVNDYLAPTVNGSPAAAEVITDGNGRTGFGNSLLFDGSNDNLNFGDNYDMGTSDFSISAWVKTSSATHKLIVSKRSAYNGAEDGYDFSINASGVIGSYIGNGSVGGGASVTPSISLHDGNWHHVATVFDRDGNNSIYVDGTLQGATSISGISGDADTGTSFFIGGGTTNGSFWKFTGAIDEVMIWQRALSAAEIQTLYYQQQEWTARGPEQRVFVTAFSSSAQTISHQTATTVVFGSESFDTARAMNQGTGVFTAPVAGYYHVAASLGFDANGTGIRNCGIYKNGTLTFLGVYAPVTAATSSSASATVYCAPGDTLEIKAWQNSGGGLAVGSGTNPPDESTWVSIERIG